MRLYFSFTLVALFILLVDLYVFKAIVRSLQNWNTRKLLRQIVYFLFWLTTLFFLLMFGYLFKNRPDQHDLYYYNTIFLWLAISLTVFLPKLVIISFHFIDDLYNLLRKLFKRKDHIEDNKKANTISRKTFITQTGIILSAIPFAGSIYGILKGRFDFHFINTELSFSKLPKAFDKFKIIQISDFHIGSFIDNIHEVERIVSMINSKQADLVVFTGDIVNNLAKEMDNFIPMLSSIKAKYGKYAILGNHDYGDYTQWDTEQQKIDNHSSLKNNLAKSGFRLLLNEHTKINISGSTINLVGVENWGHPPFPKYGDLDKATKGMDDSKFSLLLSHDPSHWDAKVLNKTNIDLTLSGHTHGMQFGIDIPGFKWSPIQYKYPRWAGLYKVSNQYLYVNRGIGYIGLATRIGIRPEISLISLNSTS